MSLLTRLQSTIHIIYKSVNIKQVGKQRLILQGETKYMNNLHMANISVNILHLIPFLIISYNYGYQTTL
jgi:hypothetical protein